MEDKLIADNDSIIKDSVTGIIHNIIDGGTIVRLVLKVGPNQKLWSIFFDRRQFINWYEDAVKFHKGASIIGMWVKVDEVDGAGEMITIPQVNKEDLVDSVCEM